MLSKEMFNKHIPLRPLVLADSEIVRLNDLIVLALVFWLL